MFGWPPKHRGEVAALAISSDGREAVTGADADLTLRLWSLPSKKLEAKLRGHMAGVYCAAWSPDGRLIASGGGPAQRFSKRLEDTSIRLWDVHRREETRTILTYGYRICALEFTQDNRRLISAASARKGEPENVSLKVWSVDQGSEITAFKSGRYVDAITLASDQDTLAAASHPLSSDEVPQVRIYSLQEQRETKTLEEPDRVVGLKFLPGTRHLIGASEDLRIWDCDSGIVVRQYKREELIGISAIDVSRDGRFVACACGGQNSNYQSARFRVVILDLVSGKVEEVFKNRTPITHVAFCLQDSHVAASGPFGEFRILKLGRDDRR